MVLDEYHALDMISREKSNTTAVFTGICILYWTVSSLLSIKPEI